MRPHAGPEQISSSRTALPRKREDKNRRPSRSGDILATLELVGDGGRPDGSARLQSPKRLPGRSIQSHEVALLRACKQQSAPGREEPARRRTHKRKAPSLIPRARIDRQYRSFSRLPGHILHRTAEIELSLDEVLGRPVIDLATVTAVEVIQPGLLDCTSWRASCARPPCPGRSAYPRP